jgi:hypothetical protein
MREAFTLIRLCGRQSWWRLHSPVCCKERVCVPVRTSLIRASAAGVQRVLGVPTRWVLDIWVGVCDSVVILVLVHSLWFCGWRGVSGDGLLHAVAPGEMKVWPVVLRLLSLSSSPVPSVVCPGDRQPALPRSTSLWQSSAQHVCLCLSKCPRCTLFVVDNVRRRAKSFP